MVWRNYVTVTYVVSASLVCVNITGVYCLSDIWTITGEAQSPKEVAQAGEPISLVKFCADNCQFLGDRL